MGGRAKWQGAGWGVANRYKKEVNNCNILHKLIKNNRRNVHLESIS